MNARVVSVSRAAGHGFSKTCADAIVIEAGLGVTGDAHRGVTVKHRSRVAKDPTAPNLRQVHLLHSELFAELADQGFAIAPGDIGENILTAGIDLLGLPQGARLHLGPEAIVEITGLRNPCRQIDAFRRGLMQAVLDKDASGALVRKAGVMSIVVAGGEVRCGDTIRVALPTGEHQPLMPV